MAEYRRRVVVTGLGAVSPLGCDVRTNWENMLAGKSGVGPLTRFPATEQRCQIAGEVKNFDISAYVEEKEAARLDIYCHYAIGAASEALTQAGIGKGHQLDPSRVGVLIASGIGGLNTICNQFAILQSRGPGRVSPLTIPMLIADMASGYVAIMYNLRGPNFSLASACASGLHAVGEASWIIRRGDADVMLAGGAEGALHPLGLAGFGSMRALSTRNDDPTRASRPFDAGRDGFVPAEGAGVLVLEELDHALARGATPLAEVVGYGATGDAYHITAPQPDGSGAATAIRMALRHADLRPEAIDYVNAHGTSTPINDAVETRTLKLALGEHAYKVAVSSTKSMTGHTLGAAGGLESMVCVQVLQHGLVPPTINYETPDPECDLDIVPNESRALPVKVALKLNLGFGGHNAAVLFRQIR